MSSTIPFDLSSSRNMHNELIELGVKLGYFNNRGGACAGVTMAWLSACLTDEKQVAKYLRFTKEITAAGPGLFDKITAMQAKASRKEELTNEDKELFQYLAFYEQIALYLQPSKYNALFDQSLHQGNIEEISGFANSASLEEKGGLSVVYSESAIFTLDELKAYLTEIAKSVSPDTGTIALFLTSHNHAIGLTYHPNNRSWQFMDINEGEPQALDIDSIANKVLDGFNLGPEPIPRHLYTALNTRVIIVDEPLKCESLGTSLQQLKVKHPVSRELATRMGAVNLLWLAAMNGDVGVIMACINEGADVNQAATNGATPLYLAVQLGQIDVVRALLAHGAKVNQAKTNGVTPLFLAAQKGTIDIVRELLANGADVNQAATDSFTPLCMAIQQGHIDVVRELIAHGAEVNKPVTNGQTPLCMAIQQGHIDVVRALIAHGAEVNLPMPNGVTPLCLAAQKGHIDVVRELLLKGATVNLAMPNGVTPLYLAAQKGYIDVVRELLANGAKVNQATTNGKTPLDIATQQGQIEVMRALQAACGRSTVSEDCKAKLEKIKFDPPTQESSNTNKPR